MELTKTQWKYIAIGVVAAVGFMFLLGLLWDLLWKLAGILIAVGLIALGIRFLFGKGLPDSLIDKVDKE
ncbi:hypothetical protein EDM80_03645 [bacterium]|nr:MAG: hypothetical protein EDM80_03645 [bacterium]RIK64148.1 MAG: hypothetical protein DCC64_05395 [Planctomycetota bacterium]